ncbi:MAG: UDP-N-acetylglucosamine 2-epimerase (non-hydrolyzing) [Vicingaceae bacterium]|nr:UDP-N-acetylglucosamine 2-epimerase (non-hydrolyzing) [Vicingaceae bacterium]
MLITIIAGARPNFIKIAPIIEAIEIQKQKGIAINYRLVHTGQHYDKKMSHDFFEQLQIPKPHVNLGAGGGSQAKQTANIMVGFEQELMQNPSQLVLVVGDVTSTMACSIVAKKLNVKVAHVEAGIRSGDQTMPEEINRMLTDSITDFFFTTTELANSNLKKLGVDHEKIFFVGNTMIDTLLKNRARFIKPEIWKSAKLSEKEYFVVTLHRPANVDEEDSLSILLQEIARLSRGLPIIFPVHPRTAKKLEKIIINYTNLHLVEPMSYLEFNYLVEKAKAVITDSGGITEETTVMHIPCLTLRDNTERPETCEIGTNALLGTNPEALAPAMKKIFDGKWTKGKIPVLWDGKTSERIIRSLLSANIS